MLVRRLGQHSSWKRRQRQTNGLELWSSIIQVFLKSDSMEIFKSAQRICANLMGESADFQAVS